MEKENRFNLMCVSLLFVYLAVKYLSPLAVESLFNGGAIALLNAFAQTDKTKSLDFYSGMLDQNVFGPLGMVLSGLCLALVCLRYFSHASGLTVGCIIFIYLLIVKFDVLFFPPYGETGAGPMAEAIWLYRNHFDYVGLFNEQNYAAGGPKVYFFSIYPFLVALLLTITHSPALFIFVYHLLMFVSASVIVSVFRLVLLKVYDRQTALLLSILLLALPLFQSMTELIDMELLCLFFAVLSVYFLVNRKIGLACLMAVLSSAAKAPGGVVCATVFLVSLGLFLWDPEFRKRPRILLWSALALGFGLMKVYLLKTFIRDTYVPAGAIEFLVGWRPLLESKFLLLFLGLGLFGILWAWDSHRQAKNKGNTPFFIRHFVPIVCMIFVLGWFGMYVNVSVMGPRYKLLLAPFLLFSVFFALFSFIRSERVRRNLLLITILVAFAGAYGLFHPKKVKSYTYAYNELERSLEYRNDLKLDINLAKTMEKDFSGYAIGAPFVIAQQLAIPELGYVKKPLDVTIYGFEVQYGDIKNFPGLASMNLSQTIWIGFRHEPSTLGLEYPIDSTLDKVVKELRVGKNKVILFQGGYAIERMAQVYAFARARALKKIGQ